jgi:hypothetical protein
MTSVVLTFCCAESSGSMAAGFWYWASSCSSAGIGCCSLF